MLSRWHTPRTFGSRVLAFYQNARGEFVLSYAAFQTLDPDAICAGRLATRASAE